MIPPPPKPPTIPPTYTFDLEILKEAGDTGLALAGAEFSLYKGKDLIKLVDITPEDGVPTYAPSENGTVERIVTDATGKFEIKGLDDAVTYTLKEVKAPSGYNPISDIDFIIEATYDELTNELDTVTVTSKTMTSTESGAGATIINNKGLTLPETGGMGTTAFSIIGGSLMLAASIFLFTKSRKAAKK